MLSRLLMIGLDGTDQVLMNSLVKAGRLPNIERLLQHGNARKVAFPIGASDDSQWAAFQYACDLGHHGRYFWKRTAGFDGRFIFCDDEEEALPAFWQSIGTHCGRVAIFDLPKCRPTPEINGLHLTDWSVQGRYGNRVRSWPTSSTHPLQADRDADALQAIFARVDRGLGQLIQSAGKHAAVVLFSTSGFSESGSMDHFGDAITQALNKKLQREHAASGVNPIRVHSPRLGGFEAAPAPVTAGYHSKHGFVISPPEYDRYLPASLVRMQDLGPAAIRYLGA